MQQKLWMIADIGGTNTRCAIARPQGEIAALRKVRNDAHPTLSGALSSYLSDLPDDLRPGAAALAVAAPIRGERIELTNRDGWGFERDDLCAELGVSRLEVVNDFTAVAHCVPLLQPTDVIKLGGGTPLANAPIAVLGPGTGLGASGLIPTPTGWSALAAEGGHVTLAASNDYEAQIIAAARRRFGHVSAETFLCGKGLPALWQSIAQVEGAPVGTVVPSAQRITGDAANGDTLAARTMEVFFAMLGAVAGDLAMTLGALGGVYLAGGILPEMQNALLNSDFRRRFDAKGDYQGYVRPIPTFLIVQAQPGLLGLQSFIAAA